MAGTGTPGFRVRDRPALVPVSGSVKKYCAYYEGNNRCKELPVKKQYPKEVVDGDSTYCVFKASDITKVLADVSICTSAC
ncbi:hypothetical protein AAVH_12977 [Aphelenchoides avenae]|nr:hypothetical protein AAVH_12977 [Aphelenchus avenae]